MRINPQVGGGSIATVNTAETNSKFGVPIEQRRRDIIGAYEKYPWLDAIHVHTGSQGCPPELLTAGIRTVLDLALEVNEHLGRRIRCFDLGGGLPAQFLPEDPIVDMAGYAALLKQRCPELFDGHFELVTEFGRSLHSAAGWIMTTVEYVKDFDIAVLQAGADLMLRECYHPHDWPHQLSVLNAEGVIKKGPERPWVLAGPLCFGGDVLQAREPLPAIEAGDRLLIHDTGANSLALWSRHTSRQTPRVLGYTRAEANEPRFEVLKERESLEAIWDFWR